MDKEIKAIIFDYIGTLVNRDEELFNFTIEVLDALKPKYKMCLVSKADNVNARKKGITSLGLGPYFDFILVNNKKGTDHFKYCIKRFNFPSENVLVVGDRASREIKIGNELGCKTCWISFGDRSSDSPNQDTGPANYVIKDIRGLISLL